MPDFRELYTSPDFEAYQRHVVDELVSWLHWALFEGEPMPAREVKAGLDVARRILSIPQDFVGGDVGKRLAAVAKSRLVEIPAAILRRELYKE